MACLVFIHFLIYTRFGVFSRSLLWILSWLLLLLKSGLLVDFSRYVLKCYSKLSFFVSSFG